jgi:hypothetical protein
MWNPKMDTRWVSRTFINYTSFGASITMIFYDGHISSGSVSLRQGGQYYTNNKNFSPTGVES